MVEKSERSEPPARSKAEMVERLVGLSRQHDQEDVEYWRHATDEVRGRTLYKLLARGKLIRASVGDALQEDPPRRVLKPRSTDGQPRT